MSKKYFISDCHFGHKNILKFRPEFTTVEEHDQTIIDNILTQLTKRDTLWMLGDMFFDVESLNKFGEQIRKNVGYSHLILGNHDTDNVKRAENVGQMWTMFDSVRALHSDKGFWMSHAPIHPSELRGRCNIHGHIHREVIDDPRYVNVCCEQIGYSPISFEEIKERVHREEV